MIKKPKKGLLFFDEKFGLAGYEDYDYWYRVRFNYNTVYTNRACYQHKHSSTQNLLDQKERQERDIKSLEYFKTKWGEYPENLFHQMYPEQWQIPYWEGF